MTNIEFMPRTSRTRHDWDLQDILEDLRTSRNATHNIRHDGHIRELPSPGVVIEVLQHMCAALFPSHLGNAALTPENTDVFVSNNLTLALNRLAEQVARGLHFTAAAPLKAGEAKSQSRAITQAFAQQLPKVRAALVADLRAMFRADPSAGSLAEVLLCSRGATAIIYHRLAHVLHGLGASMVARVISDVCHATTGIDIHPGARIGEGAVIPHGTGLVIGGTAQVGRNVRLSQGVTLGPLPTLPGATRKAGGARRDPIVEDNVILHPGATVVGPVTIGKAAVICGNAFVTTDIAPGQVVTAA